MNFLNFSLLVDAVVEVADDCISRQLERILLVEIEASTEEDVYNLSLRRNSWILSKSL